MGEDRLETAAVTVLPTPERRGEREPDAVYLATQADLAELERRLAFVPVHVGQYERVQALAARVLEAGQGALAWCPPSRELELGLQSLEQALHWFAAAMARNE